MILMICLSGKNFVMVVSFVKDCITLISKTLHFQKKHSPFYSLHAGYFLVH